MTTASAPGKVYLFGEHAVVYGQPAIPCAIERRAEVTVEERDDDGLGVHAEDLSLDGFTVEYSGTTDEPPAIDAPEPLVEAALGYVEEAVKQARDAADAPAAGFDVTIDSDIPLGAGLGSSAAVVVAAIDAATRELGVELDRSALADRAYRVEHAVQDGQASRADTFCSTMGGAVRVEGDDCQKLEAFDLPIVIGYDGSAGDTAALVSGVRQLKERYAVGERTIESIGELVRSGERALEEEDQETIGELMDVNHGLLSALGVSSRSLDAMVWAARDAGAIGAKLTGAGGGGCIVALDPGSETRTALQYTPECEQTFRAELAETGVRRE